MTITLSVIAPIFMKFGTRVVEENIIVEFEHEQDRWRVTEMGGNNVKSQKV